MNNITDMKFTGPRVAVSFRSLSDGSKVYAVVITDADDQQASFECVSENAASKAMDLIHAAILEASV